MKVAKHYLSLTFKGDNSYHHQGKRLRSTERIVTIGETADSDVRYDSGGLEPVCYASIIRNDDEKSWRIVKRTQYIDISIAGKGNIGYAQQLEDGDVIHFGQQPMVLVFHQHYDDRYDQAEDDVPLWRWGVPALLGLVAMMTIVLMTHRHDGITIQDVESLETSIYWTKVDSVARIVTTQGEERQLGDTKVLTTDAPTGTAFLTTDGRLVTARHCVEYWLGMPFELTTKVEQMEHDDIRRWAVETETYNQTHDADSTMTLRVYFSVYDYKGDRKYTFASSDAHVHIYKEYDKVYQLVDFVHEYYWRSIRPYFTYRKMEMGDILWIDSIPERGSIQMATRDVEEELTKGTALMLCGYPLTGMGDKRMMVSAGTLLRDGNLEEENLYFNSDITHGFSGGPVLMKTGLDIVAVGVVSRVDSVSSGMYKWAVPITKISDEE